MQKFKFVQFLLALWANIKDVKTTILAIAVFIAPLAQYVPEGAPEWLVTVANLISSSAAAILAFFSSSSEGGDENKLNFMKRD